KQAAARAAVALVLSATWPAYIASVTSSEEYRRPAYPYQRAAYQYSNVTYVENTALVSPFTPELGRITTAPRIVRFLTSLVFTTPSLGGALTAQEGFWWLTLDTVVKLGTPRPILWWTVLVPMSGLGLVILAGAFVMLQRRQWLLPACCAATALLICLTPWREQFVRYFTPMVPFLAIMLVTALGLALDFAATRGAGGARARGMSGGLVLGVPAPLALEDAFAVSWTFGRVGGATYYDRTGRPTSGRLLFYERGAALDDALEQ